MEEIEARTRAKIARRITPRLEAEFGAEVLARMPPLTMVVDAAITARFDTETEIYRFTRVCCGLEARSARSKRRILVARIATQPVPQEERLMRLERVAFDDADVRDGWAGFLPE